MLWIGTAVQSLTKMEVWGYQQNLYNDIYCKLLLWKMEHFIEYGCGFVEYRARRQLVSSLNGNLLKKLRPR